MVGIFKANNPFNTFLLFIYGLVFKYAFFTNGSVPVIKKNDTILFKELVINLQITGTRLPFIYPLIAYLFLFTQAITFNRLVNNQRLIQPQTFLPAMSYLLITSMFAEWNSITPALIINTFLIWIFGRLTTLYNNPNPKTALFNIGMAIGITSFIYFPSLAFATLIIFALMMNRPFDLAEWVTALMGIVTPYYFVFVWLFLTDRVNQFKIPAFRIGYPALNHNYWPIVAIVLVLIAFITGAKFVQANITRQVVQVRKNWSLILVYLALAIMITFINDTHTFEYWILPALPLSAFAASAFFYPSRRWFPVSLHWLMAGYVIFISYFLQQIL